MERLTLDMTAIRDIVYADRPRHTEASKLLKLAEDGIVELGIPPQGRLADLAGNLESDLAERMRDLLNQPGVIELPQVARPSEVTFPSPTLFPGYVVEGLHEAWNAIFSTWNGPGRRPQAFDRWYVESHIAGNRGALITDDEGLRTMCDRLRLEHGFVVQGEELCEYVARQS